MSTTIATASTVRVVSLPERLKVYGELSKPRIAVLVLMTVLVAGLLASWGQPNPLLLAWTVLGTALVAGSASVGNQWIERRRDARMFRTAGRPIPSGRIGATEALLLSLAMLAAGTVILFSGAGWLASGLGLLTWMIYLGLYTPLKPVTSWNTVVGAVAGAMPVMIGWVACGGRLSAELVALWLIVFLWQFPHFMAIAWLYRDDYARGGYKMLSVVDPSGRAAGVQAVMGAACLLPTSLSLVFAFGDFMSATSAAICAVSVFVAGVIQLLLAARFLWKRDTESARWLVRASLIYLPFVLGVIACGPAF
jgi:protoheme IX farnesyltransferase